MSSKDFTIAFETDKTPQEAYDAINNVRGWWGAGIQGESENVDDEFVYRHKDLHWTKQRVIELVPGQKVVWLITEAILSFVENKTEWTGTKVIFNISERNGKTEVRLTHEGLTPEVECFDACSGGWTHYVTKSLTKLVATGKGQPDETSIAMAAQ